ncbi:MAG: enolase C-terminal domain-like protein [Bryobacteraceae bacterium]
MSVAVPSPGIAPIAPTPALVAADAKLTACISTAGSGVSPHPTGSAGATNGPVGYNFSRADLATSQATILTASKRGKGGNGSGTVIGPIASIWNSDRRTAVPTAALCSVSDSSIVHGLFLVSITLWRTSRARHRKLRSCSRWIAYNVFVSSINLSRRAFVLGAPMLALGSARATDICIDDVTFSFEDYLYRTPIKFGGTEVDRVTLLNVHVQVRNSIGKVVEGFGSMPLGNVWSFPSKLMSYDRTLQAMKVLSDRIAKITRGHKEFGHPVDLNWSLEDAYLKAADEVSKELKLEQPIPKLCALVVASPFDAATHDAYGKLHKRSSYQTYGPDLMQHDLSHYIGPEFRGEYLEKYVLKMPKASMPLYHLVGAVDAIEAADVKKRINDGLPETLPEWIDYNGLTNIKIKLNGEDLKWDVERVLRVDKSAAQAQKKRGVRKWVYSLDFNEKCPNVAYLIEMMRTIQKQAPAGFERIQYVEQPTKRDLKADRKNVMHEAAKIRPVVIDESLTDKEMLMLSRDMGYSGTALKACKGQTQALLMGAVAQKYKMFLCVQDLTCPGASLIHSAGLASHVPGVAAIEANARQYVPIANKGWEKKFPGIFQIRDGQIKTGILTGDGLGAV